MKIDKKGGHILLSGIKSEELFAFLKFQVPATIVFIDKNGNRADNDILLFTRDCISGTKLIEIEIDGISDMIEYSELLNKISEVHSTGYIPCIMITIDVFKEKEPLIMLMETINHDYATNCVYIDYYNNVFEVVNKPFSNGDPDKLYYFELNDTILGFSKDGPILITDNPGINSIDDVIGK